MKGSFASVLVEKIKHISFVINKFEIIFEHQYGFYCGLWQKLQINVLWKNGVLGFCFWLGNQLKKGWINLLAFIFEKLKYNLSC